MRIKLLLLSLAVLTAAVRAQTQDDAITRIENSLIPPVVLDDAPSASWTLAERMLHYHTPGVSVAVMRGGRIIWAKGYGVREYGKPTRVNTDTLFQAASISKSVAAMGALRMVEQGAFSLDENVNLKLKTWKVPDNQFTAVEKVTLRRLLSHTAGLTVHGFRGYAEGEAVPTLVQILNGTKPANSQPIRVDVAPGSLYRYSGGGFTVVQQLMIDAGGVAFPTLMRRLVLGPIGMDRSTYEQPLPEALRANAARGHGPDGKAIKGLWHTYPELAAAGLWTTSTDLAKFALELRAEARGNSGKVLSPEMARTMLRVEKQGYGLGVGIQGEGERMRFSHGGANEGFRSFFVLYKDSGDGAAIMTNGDLGDQLFLELLRSIATEYGWPDYRQERKTAVPVAPETLKKYEGIFDLQGDHFRFAVEEGSLCLFLSFRPKVKLFAETETRFFALEDNIPVITFVPNAEGKVEEIRLMGRTARKIK